MSAVNVFGALAYAQTKFGCAVEALATGDVPLRERLEVACRHIGPVLLDMKGMPPEVASRIRGLRARLVWAGDAAVTLDAASDAEVRRLASLVVDIHEQLVFAQEVPGE